MTIQPWNLVFLVGFIFYVAIRGVFIERTKRNDLLLVRMDWLEKSLLALVAIGSLLTPALYLSTPWLAFADYRLPQFAPWFGSAVMTASLWLFWRSHVDLGLNWSKTLEVRKGHQLIQHGVYRSIRHPMYAAILLFGLGQALLLENWLAGWSAFVTFAVLFVIRTPREERMMCEAFGQEYVDYKGRTGRILPSGLLCRRQI